MNFNFILQIMQKCENTIPIQLTQLNAICSNIHFFTVVINILQFTSSLLILKGKFTNLKYFVRLKRMILTRKIHQVIKTY